jgi:hypothetical protein
MAEQCLDRVLATLVGDAREGAPPRLEVIQTRLSAITDIMNGRERASPGFG